MAAKSLQGELPKSEMSWEICPEGLEAFLFRAYKEFGKKPIYVTENGIAGKDTLLDAPLIIVELSI
ncbi:family 1 glycosylhydrolase [Mesotoga sp. UBA6090]|uniref:family 1 glycosylhydrolase n=1 Tax=Mesotoga sp. UBA6090 TaxID=1946860 RepID=UPI0025FA9574|nr:family 1 glycosylhydrolase [Mesotoga sp. UBA6090]